MNGMPNRIGMHLSDAISCVSGGGCVPETG